MAWQEMTYKLSSVAPLIAHNGQLADPTNYWTKEIKKLSGKRNKTDADFEQMARLEFFGGLYLNKSGPVLPAEMFDSMMLAAAKKSKEGPLAKSGVFCLREASLEYDGPRIKEDLWTCDNPSFRFVKAVRVGTSRVMRTRPIFHEWACVVTFNVEANVVNPARLDEWLQVAGTVIGLGDWRPQYGRFTAVRLNG